MNTRIGRNDPCHCGSGRKYKNCHLRDDEAPAAPPPAKAHGDAVEIALEWLMQHHRKGLKVAFESLMDSVVPPEANVDPARLDEEFSGALHTNLTEWMLAEGEILIKGEQRSIARHLLGPAGPPLSAGQRDWIEKLALHPLRLYTVTNIVPEQSLTLCDAMDVEAAPVVVQERMGTRGATVGMLIGARVIPLAGHFELSGAIFPISHLATPDTLARMAAAQELLKDPADQRRMQSIGIAASWARQYYAPPPPPKMVDMVSGDALLFITDHFRVIDRAALVAALGACPDVEGDADQGWRRLVVGSDQAIRPVVSVNPGKAADRIEVFYKTQAHADAGRAWFDTLAGGAVQFLTREISDPRGMMSTGLQSPPGLPPPKGPTLPPEVIAVAIEQVIKRNYANWADEPIPALGNKTPRAAVCTPAGLERVKGLLRSYEEGEDRMAQAQGRRVISYRFLWDTLGIEP